MDRIILIGTFLLLLTSIVRFLTIAKWSVTERFLSLALVALLLNTVVLYVYFQDNLEWLTYLYRWGTLSTFIFVPACFHYIKYSMTKGQLIKVDLLLYLPALIYFLDFIPFFLSSYHSKYDALVYDFNNNISHLHVQSNILPPGTYFTLQNAMGCLLAIWLLVVTIPANIRQGGKSYFSDNKTLIFWNITLSALLFITCLPDFLFAVTGKKFDFKSFTYVTPCLFLYTLFPLSILMAPYSYRFSKGFWVRNIHNLKPAHLFTIGELYPDKEVEDILSHSKRVLYESREMPTGSLNLIGVAYNPKIYIDSDKAEKIKSAIDTVIMNEKLYQQEHISIDTLAEHVSYPANQIQALLSDYLNTSLNDYLKTF